MNNGAGIQKGETWICTASDLFASQWDSAKGKIKRKFKDFLVHKGIWPLLSLEIRQSMERSPFIVPWSLTDFLLKNGPYQQLGEGLRVEIRREFLKWASGQTNLQ